jgi:hypothetical protein
VGTAVASQVEVGEVGAAAMKQGTQKLRGGDMVGFRGSWARGEARTPSSFPIKVLALLPLRAALRIPTSLLKALVFSFVEKGVLFSAWLVGTWRGSEAVDL